VELQLVHLRTLEAVARDGSFSLAALRLRLTQPAVSMHVRQLEDALGVRLLERMGRRVRPTAAGALLLEHAGRAARELDRAVERLHELRGVAAGHVRLGTGTSISMYLLPPLLRLLRRRYPGVELVVTTNTAAVVAAAVADNDLDVGVLSLPIHRPELAIAPFLTDEFVAIGARRHWRARGPLDAAALAGEVLILDQRGATSRQLIDDWFRRSRVTPTVPIELDNPEAAKALAAAGLGVSIASRHSVQAGPTGRRLACRSLSPPLPYPLAIVRRHDKPAGAALDAVLGALAEVRRQLERPRRGGPRPAGGSDRPPGGSDRPA
jgi:DNA-binding transcriptional LysR family regulator